MTAIPQHMQALTHANEIRMARATLKQHIFDGELTAADVLLDPPACAVGMTVAALLCAQRRWAETRAGRLLRSLRIGETRRVGELTERQRHVLAERLTWGAS